MASGNFERCLAITLKWEGEYSNNADDPGGPTMRGITQVEYDRWRKAQGLGRRPIRKISEDELTRIYKVNYWDAAGCEELPPGVDLCIFDAAVNSGPARAKLWLADGADIDVICDSRLGFLQQTGRLWRVFGLGWRRRVAGIRLEAYRMAGAQPPAASEDATLHPGMMGPEIRRIQEKLRALGYPCGAVDGIYGEQTYRAVTLFQQDHDLAGDPGIWRPDYEATLGIAEPVLPRRKAASVKDLESAGDPPMQRMNLMQRIFAWFFGASAAAQICENSSVLDSMGAMRSALQPMLDLWQWASGHCWLLMALICAGLIALIRKMRADHVRAFQNFDYQGASQAGNK